MPEEKTRRHELPLLQLGQAQKEVTHNEALVRIDALLNPVIEAVLAAPPPSLTVSSDGLCWIIASGATGLWAGKDRQIARWSGGGWRYLMPVEGMSAWNVALMKRLFYINGNWITPTPIASPAGGTVIDVEARTAINAILAHLRQITNIPV
jgi:hypothetical protein